jgi:hypothetical protein
MKFMKAFRVLEEKMYIEKLKDHLLLVYGTLLRWHSIETSHKTRVSDSWDNIDIVKYHSSRFFYLLLFEPNQILIFLIRYVKILTEIFRYLVQTSNIVRTAMK